MQTTQNLQKNIGKSKCVKLPQVKENAAWALMQN